MAKTKKNKSEVENLAAIYLRFSSHRQGEQSIEGQRSAAENYAAEHGYKVVKEYIDRAETGRTDDREGFQEMLSDATKGIFGVIIVWKVDRFGRNREEIGLNKLHCKRHGVRVEYVAESIPDAPEGVILESVLEGFAEYYSLQLAQNVKRGQKKSAEKCHTTGGSVPLGYNTTPEHKYVIDPETVPAVKKIFELCADGYTIPDVVEYLNGAGYRTKKGTEFAKNSIYSVLKNKKYIGIYSYNNGEIEIPDGVPRIVSDELYYKAQEAVKSRKRRPTANWYKGSYLLSDRLFCGHCGGAMRGDTGTSKNGTRHYYYSCSNKKRYKNCNKKSIRQDIIDNLVIQKVKWLLYDDELLKLIVNRTWELYVKSDESINEIERLEKQRASIDAAINNLIRATEFGAVSETITKRIITLEEQKKAIQGEIVKIRAVSYNHLTKEKIEMFLFGLRNNNFEDFDSQRKLVKMFVNSVFVFDDRLTITFNYGGKEEKVSLNDIKAAESDGAGVFARRLSRSTKTNADEHTTTIILLFKNVFAVNVEIPQE